jgi:hypothetical protein
MGVGPLDSPAFIIAPAVVIRTILFRRRIGIRQWFVLSKWSKNYKQLQKKIDEKLDYDNNNNEGMKCKDSNGIYFCTCIR